MMHTASPSPELTPPPLPLAADHRLLPMTPEMLDTIVLIENVAFTHPWTRGNFADALRSGYHTQVLMRGDEILGYYIAMQVLDEVHLLNITISPLHQKQGFARELLDCLAHWSRYEAKAQWLWLEVRESNLRARQIYERHGFTQVGARKKYYPVHHGERETAILMSMHLWP